MQKGITTKENEVDPLMWNCIHYKTEKKQCGEVHMSKGSLGEIDVKSGLPGEWDFFMLYLVLLEFWNQACA